MPRSVAKEPDLFFLGAAAMLSEEHFQRPLVGLYPVTLSCTHLFKVTPHFRLNLTVNEN